MEHTLPKKQTLHALLAWIVLLIIVFVGVYALPAPNASHTPDSDTASTPLTTTKDSDTYHITATYLQEPLDTQDTIGSFVSSMIQDYETQWSAQNPDMQAVLALATPEQPFIPYELTIDYTTTQAHKLGITTHTFISYAFTGGAHGTSQITTFSFDAYGALPLERLIDLDNGNDIAITRLIKAKLPTALGDMYDETMANEGLGLAYLRPDGTFDNQACGCDGFLYASNLYNFIPKDEGITFAFPPYQVAPYASGIPEVTLSWQELQPYMRPEL